MTLGFWWRVGGVFGAEEGELGVTDGWSGGLEVEGELGVDGVGIVFASIWCAEACDGEELEGF